VAVVEEEVAAVVGVQAQGANLPPHARLHLHKKARQPSQLDQRHGFRFGVVRVQKKKCDDKKEKCK
jgi:hypothetical protein